MLLQGLYRSVSEIRKNDVNLLHIQLMPLTFLCLLLPTDLCYDSVVRRLVAWSVEEYK